MGLGSKKQRPLFIFFGVYSVFLNSIYDCIVFDSSQFAYFQNRRSLPNVEVDFERRKTCFALRQK